MKTDFKEFAIRLLGFVFLVAACGLSFLSFVSRYEDWQSVATARTLNFLVIGPLWAATAALCCRGKTRMVLVLLALIVPASGLSLFQYAVAHLRFAPMSPQMTTSYALRATAQRIQAYMQKHRAAPPSLSALPILDDEAFQAALDGWGCKLRYSIDPQGVITLISLGADGKPGGEGADADLTVRDRTRNTDWTLNVDDPTWIGTARTEAWISNRRVDR